MRARILGNCAHPCEKPSVATNRPASERSLTVVLDEDVAEVFTTTESVNRALRALIEIVPQPISLKKR